MKSLRAVGRTEAEISAIMATTQGQKSDLADGALWAEHAVPFRAFLLVSRQWRVAAGLGALAYLGLDYAACDVAWRHAGLSITAQVFDDLQVIELEALRLLNQPREKT